MSKNKDAKSAQRPTPRMKPSELRNDRPKQPWTHNRPNRPDDENRQEEALRERRRLVKNQIWR